MSLALPFQPLCFSVVGWDGETEAQTIYCADRTGLELSLQSYASALLPLPVLCCLLREGHSCSLLPVALSSVVSRGSSVI